MALRSQLSLMQSRLMGTLSVWPSTSTSISGLSLSTVATFSSTCLARALSLVLPLWNSILSLSEMKTTLFSTFTVTSVSFRLPRLLLRLTTRASVTESFLVRASCRRRMRRSCSLICSSDFSRLVASFCESVAIWLTLLSSAALVLFSCATWSFRWSFLFWISATRASSTDLSPRQASSWRLASASFSFSVWLLSWMAVYFFLDTQAGSSTTTASVARRIFGAFMARG